MFTPHKEHGGATQIIVQSMCAWHAYGPNEWHLKNDPSEYKLTRVDLEKKGL